MQTIEMPRILSPAFCPGSRHHGTWYLAIITSKHQPLSMIGCSPLPIQSGLQKAVQGAESPLQCPCGGPDALELRLRLRCQVRDGLRPTTELTASMCVVGEVSTGQHPNTRPTRCYVHACHLAMGWSNVWLTPRQVTAVRRKHNWVSS